MGTTSSRRVSVREYHLPYLTTFGEVLGTDDLSEVVNHILNCHRMGCHSTPPSQPFTQNASIPVAIASASTIQQQAINDNDLVDALGDLLSAA
ncbi:hypothetical protein [Coleofasciculus sp. FACHB-SPT9]|uniref:hypothetical protein n=1 Tax=Cyanophyceae TaxID=3028117 RepID=UPI001687E4DC|nr:hypothetical protein [Coleofasciculus sp. FACHB-SPT9]MBD1890493.1 hypothetical protein [Coleofasciculus sp. FACHB-SPT9]